LLVPIAAGLVMPFAVYGLRRLWYFRYVEPTYITAVLSVLIVYLLSRLVFPQMTLAEAVVFAVATLAHRSWKVGKRNWRKKYNPKA
jgi:hypothetical protein